jgi:pimeloyl-ACP methyl ester carboxylesterase
MHTHNFTGAAGLRLAASVGGPVEGQPVVLLHGGGQTRHAWRHAAADLARTGRRVISLDLRGHGDSDWSPEADYSFDGFAADLRTVLDTLDEPPALVGASLGGLTALLVAGEEPRVELRALVLVDVVPRLEREGVMQIVRFMLAHADGFASLDEAADAVAAYLPHRPRPESSGGLAKNLRAGDDGRLRWHWDPKLLMGERVPDPEPAIPRFEAACVRVRAPTLLVRGARSEMVTEAGVQDFLRLIPGAEFVDVSEAGHMVAGDDNDAFNAAIEGFLARLP